MAILKVKDKDGKVYDIPALRGPKGDKGDKGDVADIHLFANAVKGNLKGEIVRADDVSPVEHIVNVKVDHADPTSVTVTRYGKNMFDSSIPWADYTYRGNGYNSLTFFVGAGNSATFSVSKAPEKGLGGYCFIREGNGDVENPQIWMYHNTEKELCKQSLTVRSTDGYLTLFITNNLKTILAEELQVEFGATATAYEAYKGAETYTPNADGTVDGITSLSPTMTLTTDTAGVVINCEYNRDLNVVISNIAKLLGSEV